MNVMNFIPLFYFININNNIPKYCIKAPKITNKCQMKCAPGFPFNTAKGIIPKEYITPPNNI